MPTALGVHSPRIERIRELRTARGRHEQGCLAIEGPTLIDEARRSGVRFRALYAVPEQLERQPELAAFESAEVPIFTVTERLFARLSDVTTPSGLLAVVELPSTDGDAVLRRPGTVLLLAGVNDPGNAGTLLRSAEAFGAAGVLFGAGGVDAFAPKVVRAAMGALFRLPVATVTSGWLVAAAAAAGRTIVAADTSGSDIATAGFGSNVVLAIGNERRGVRDWLPSWDALVRVPQRGDMESLNAAVAGSILLYVLAQRG